VDRGIRDLIREMNGANPLWGAPRIHGELLKLGIQISQATVARYMVRRTCSPSPTWRNFLSNQIEGIAAIDMFVVASASFRLLYVMVILSHARRRIVRFDVVQHPTSAWLARQVTEAFPWDTAPHYLIRDRDGSYGRVFSERLNAMGISEVVIAPRSPWQNAYVERVIGSIRRECLDHIVIYNERHLRRVMTSYRNYYHRSRTHLSLEKDCLDPRPIQLESRAKVIAIAEVGGRQLDSQPRTQGLRSDHEWACRKRAKETVLGDSYLSGEHGVPANLTASVTRSIEGLASISKRASDAKSLSEPSTRRLAVTPIANEPISRTSRRTVSRSAPMPCSTDRAASRKREWKEDAPLASTSTGSSDGSLTQMISGTFPTKTKLAYQSPRRLVGEGG
jgi:transposase InsO family protein